jgi:hypothetical protein
MLRNFLTSLLYEDSLRTNFTGQIRLDSRPVSLKRFLKMKGERYDSKAELSEFVDVLGCFRYGIFSDLVRSEGNRTDI